MKIKKEYIILILIIIGLAAYLFLRSADRTRYQLPALADLESNAITKIEISNESNSITLKKRDNRWYLESQGYLADSTMVNRMLTILETLSLTALVSESKDYQRYDLHPAKRITVKAWQAETLQRHFDIGKAATSFRHTFVRLADDNRVFHATDNFRGHFEQTTDSLRDRQVLAFKAADIQAVQITKGQASVKMVRKEAPLEPAASQPEKPDAPPSAAIKFEWQDRDGNKINDQNLNPMLTRLSNLKCVRYMDEVKKDSFSKPVYTVKLKGIVDHQLDIFAKPQKDDAEYPAVSPGSDYPFLLSDGQVQQIMKDPSEFLQKDESGAKKEVKTEKKN